MDRAVTVEVVERRELVPGEIVELRLAPVGDDKLPAWEPGAHVDLVLPSALVRQYSLTGSRDAATYTVAVLRERESRGGSAEVHDSVRPGDHLMIRGPRNHFPLVAAPHVIFVAGGIGITPIVPMIRQLQADGVPWHLHYGGRRLESMAYVDALLELDSSRVTLRPQDTVGLLPLDNILATAPEGAVVYTCGPGPLLDAVQKAAAERGIDVHLERFGPSSTPVATSDGDTEFTVTLQRSARTLTVPVGTRLIDVVRTVVPAVPFSCEEGYCGSCETAVLDGEPDHRDTVLSPEERDANDCMMICVGRSKGPHLVLDL